MMRNHQHHFIMNLKMLSMKISLLIFLSPFLTGCLKRQYSNEEVVQVIKEELTKNESEYLKLKNWIKNQDHIAPFMLRSDRMSGTMIIKDANGFSFKIEDYEYSRHLYKFLKRNFSLITYDKDYIKYTLHRYYGKNRQYRLFYLLNDSSAVLKNYKPFGKNEFPGDSCGWVHHLKDKWYLVKPCPIKENTDSIKEVERLTKQYLKAFNGDFTGRVVNVEIRGKRKLNTQQYAVIKVKLSSSTIKYHDQRGKSNYYMGVINYPYAEVVVPRNFVSTWKVGDSCIFRGKTDDLCRIGNNETKYCLIPLVYHPKPEAIDSFFSIPKIVKKQEQNTK